MKPKFEAKAHLGKEKFKERLEWGLEAQNFIEEKLADKLIFTFNSDFKEFQEDMPKIEDPEPDLEYKNCFIEVRRQEFFNRMFLGYTKKYDGWNKHATEKNKTLYFVVVTPNFKRIGILNLTKHKRAVHKRINDAGDEDYYISLNHFRIFDTEKGLSELEWIARNG